MADDVKMVPMARTPEEKKAAKKFASVPMAAEDYPWGLSLHLGKDEMDKLGMKALPEVGSEFEICCKVKVRSVSQNQTEDQEESKSVDLQVTEMGIETPEQEAAERKDPLAKAAKKLYPGE